MSVAPFEQFLVKQLSNWLDKHAVIGSRYQFQSPDAEITTRLFTELKRLVTNTINFKETPLPYIQINDVNILCVAHTENREHLPEGFNENYISTLRDEVAGQSGDFAGAALLIVHNSLLDTLISSADDLAVEGMPWATSTIKSDLEAIIGNQPKPSRILLSLLRWQAEILEDQGGSMFGYEQLYAAMSIGTEPDLTSLDLLPDKGISEMTSDKQIEKRLRDNRKLYEEIDNIVEHFPDELVERLPDLGEDFVKKQFDKKEDNSWKQTDIQTYWNEIEDQRQQALDFSTVESESANLIGPRNKKETAAGVREKHLIIVVIPDATSFDLKLSFHGKDLTKSQVSITNNSELKKQTSEIVKLTGSKKRHISVVAPFTGEPTYLTIKTNRPRTKECFTFHILVIKQGDFQVEAFENKFLVNPSKNCLTLQTEEMELKINDELSNTFFVSDQEQEASINEFGILNYQVLAPE